MYSLLAHDSICIFPKLQSHARPALFSLSDLVASSELLSTKKQSLTKIKRPGDRVVSGPLLDPQKESHSQSPVSGPNGH